MSTFIYSHIVTSPTLQEVLYIFGVIYTTFQFPLLLEIVYTNLFPGVMKLSN